MTQSVVQLFARTKVGLRKTGVLYRDHDDPLFDLAIQALDLKPMDEQPGMYVGLMDKARVRELVKRSREHVDQALEGIVEDTEDNPMRANVELYKRIVDEVFYGDVDEIYCVAVRGEPNDDNE